MLDNIEIKDVAYGGSGVGRTKDGKAIFIPFTVTGDVVTATITEDKGSYCTGELLKIVTPSTLRVTPHCKYHGICGGCQFGHIEYSAQKEIKKQFLINAMRKHPQAESLPELEQYSGETKHYRIRATFRAIKGKIGFFKAGTNDFIAVDSCPIMSDSLFKKVQLWAVDNSHGYMTSLSVIENADGAVIAMVDSKGEKINNAEVAMKCMPPFDGIDISTMRFGLDHLTFKTPFGDVGVPYGGFYQSNKFLNDKFQGYSVEMADGSRDILELYAGSGFFTSGLALKGRVTGVEGNKVAAELGAKMGYSILTGDVSMISKKKFHYDTIFLDPPREGVDKQTLTTILKDMPTRVVYVSCNPTTLARDLNRLADKYHIHQWAQFDLFPHTYHVETVVRLKKK